MSRKDAPSRGATSLTRDSIEQLTTTGRRGFLTTAASGLAVGIAGCLRSDSSGGGTTSSESTQHFGVSMKGMGQAGLFVQGQAAKWYTQDMSDVKVTVLDGQLDATKQNQDAITLINQGIDGLLLNPFDAKASTQIVEAATEADVPVMNFDTATLSKDVLLGAMFGQYRGGKVAAERFTELMDERGMESATVITSVFNFESTTSQQRLRGFTENVPDSVEIVNRIESDGTAEASAPKTQSALQANPDVDAIYSNNVGSGMGALTALKQFGAYHKTDHDDHVMAFGIDGGPELNQEIGTGYYDFAIDQPLHMYAPLTLELLWAYLDAGKDALPAVDSTVTPGDGLSIENKTVFEIQPWSKQFWGPAEMRTYESEGTSWWPWLQCNHATITKENADASYLYGNVARKYESSN